MSFKLTSIAVAGILIAGAIFTAPVFAQEPTAEHLAAARKAMAATKATDSFDVILPQASLELKKRLTNDSPDKADQIDAIVDIEALALAPRRGDLENESAKLFAASFTKEDLEKIAEFFSTEAGEKYLSSTPILARELGKAARIWATGIQRDLASNSAKKLQESGN
jgi:hypothetical protein